MSKIELTDEEMSRLLGEEPALAATESVEVSAETEKPEKKEEAPDAEPHIQETEPSAQPLDETPTTEEDSKEDKPEEEAPDAEVKEAEKTPESQAIDFNETIESIEKQYEKDTVGENEKAYVTQKSQLEQQVQQLQQFDVLSGLPRDGLHTHKGKSVYNMTDTELSEYCVKLDDDGKSAEKETLLRNVSKAKDNADRYILRPCRRSAHGRERI